MTRRFWNRQPLLMAQKMKWRTMLGAWISNITPQGLQWWVFFISGEYALYTAKFRLHQSFEVQHSYPSSKLAVPTRRGIQLLQSSEAMERIRMPSPVLAFVGFVQALDELQHLFADSSYHGPFVRVLLDVGGPSFVDS